MALLLQLMLFGVWTATMVIQIRRLFRLACVTQLERWEQTRFRMGWNRIWWWLGQDEFWRGAQDDVLRSIEISLLIFLIMWGQMAL